MSETHLCPSRQQHPLAAQFSHGDTWDEMPDGTRTCSFCGSLHVKDMMDIMASYQQGEEGFDFHPSDKGYKVYANRPGVQNAAQGGIKFYGWHLVEPHKTEFEFLWGFAIAKYRHEMEQRWGKGAA